MIDMYLQEQMRAEGFKNQLYDLIVQIDNQELKEKHEEHIGKYTSRLELVTQELDALKAEQTDLLDKGKFHHIKVKMEQVFKPRKSLEEEPTATASAASLEEEPTAATSAAQDE